MCLFSVFGSRISPIFQKGGVVNTYSEGSKTDPPSGTPLGHSSLVIPGVWDLLGGQKTTPPKGTLQGPKSDHFWELSNLGSKSCPRGVIRFHKPNRFWSRNVVYFI